MVAHFSLTGFKWESPAMVMVALILIMLAFTLESPPIWTGLRPLQPAFKRQIIYKTELMLKLMHVIDNLIGKHSC